MKFMITWSILPGSYAAGISRFLETGAPAPAGVKLLGRWHGVDGSSHGFILVESSEAKAVYGWMAQWGDLLALTVTPVVEDADAAAALQGLKK